jgi:hypothetical protein
MSLFLSVVIFGQFIVAKNGIAKKSEGGDAEALEKVDEAVVLEGDGVRVSTASLSRSPLNFPHVCVCGVCLQDKRTLLWWAACRGRFALVDPLVKLGAGVNVQDNVSEDPAAFPPIDPHHHLLLPTCYVPTPTPPLAPVSPHNFPSMATSTLLTTHLALAHCLVLLHP